MLTLPKFTKYTKFQQSSKMKMVISVLSHTVQEVSIVSALFTVSCELSRNVLKGQKSWRGCWEKVLFYAKLTAIWLPLKVSLRKVLTRYSSHPHTDTIIKSFRNNSVYCLGCAKASSAKANSALFFSPSNFYSLLLSSHVSQCMDISLHRQEWQLFQGQHVYWFIDQTQTAQSMSTLLLLVLFCCSCFSVDT